VPARQTLAPRASGWQPKAAGSSKGEPVGGADTPPRESCRESATPSHEGVRRVPPARDRYHRGTGRPQQADVFRKALPSAPAGPTARRQPRRRVARRIVSGRCRPDTASSKNPQRRAPRGGRADWWRPLRPTSGVRTATAPERAPRNQCHRDTESGGDARATARTGRKCTAHALHASTRVTEVDALVSTPPRSGAVWTRDPDGTPRRTLPSRGGQRLCVHGTHRVSRASARR
jgi:hypothetical protein